MALTASGTCVVLESNPSQVQCKGEYFSNKSFEMGEQITKLTSGYKYTCALLADNTAKCFGIGQWGALGVGDTISQFDSASHVLEKDKTTPQQDIADMECGYNGCCAVVNEKVLCWGENTQKQSGVYIGEEQFIVYPTEITITFPSGKQVVSVARGTYVSYAIMSDNSVYAWGTNQYGEMGDPTFHPGPGSTLYTIWENAKQTALGW